MNGPSVEKKPAHKIAVQHRLIESLFDGLGSALAARNEGRAQRRTAGLQRALEGHFRLEERHYFPRMHEKRPDREADFQRLVEEHVTMRGQAEEISAQLERAEWEAASRMLDALQALFLRHEAFEHEIVDS